jgi:spore photoproduct lyase
LAENTKREKILNRRSYTDKFASFKNQTLYEKLTPSQQDFIRFVAFTHRFSFQEFRQFVDAYRDLAMWGEGDLAAWWQEQISTARLQGGALKKHLFRELNSFIKELKRAPKSYPDEGLPRPEQREKYVVTSEKTDKAIHGMCPVASESTVCCNLRTIDAVENCAFGCSYCTIQTFYSEQFEFDADFADKLKSISLQPDRFYHFGTGQSSDSLVWGNRNGILDALCQFAADHPNILLEFKTKSKNVGYFLEHEVPRNIVCSWSLNTPTIVQNEEHFTANLQQRFEAARVMADKGTKVAFHFHPMVYYQGWDTDYPYTASKVMSGFEQDEVLFISFGSVTLIKPAIKQIRNLGHASKILQMEMVPDPHGKLTYPDEIKIAMFRKIYQAFEHWQGRVFMYLCMEKASIWENALGYVYETNEEFEQDFCAKTMGKLVERRSSPLSRPPSEVLSESQPQKGPLV